MGFREQYKQYTANEQDYYGALTAMSKSIGRVRNFLRNKVGDHYFLSFTADNGPEGSYIHNIPGQPSPPCTARQCNNPGATGPPGKQLRGRKRDLTEGGIREPGLFEWPAAIKKNIRTDFPAATFDLKPTVAEILGVTLPSDWPVDGESLMPLITSGGSPSVIRKKPMGWVWGMVLGNHNHTAICGSWEEERTAIERTRNSGSVQLTGSDADRTGLSTTVDGNPNQQAWMTGDQYKLLGCNNVDGAPVRYFLYDLKTDPQERKDLAAAQPARVIAMKADLITWMASVKKSTGPTESNCLGSSPWGPVQPPGPPGPPSPAPGPFKPTNTTNCTVLAGRTMPGSAPTRRPAKSDKGCCSLCFDTSWCACAIFVGGSCNMHTAADCAAHKMAAGGGVGIVTGR